MASISRQPEPHFAFRLEKRYKKNKGSSSRSIKNDNGSRKFTSVSLPPIVNGEFRFCSHEESKHRNKQKISDKKVERDRRKINSDEILTGKIYRESLGRRLLVCFCFSNFLRCAVLLTCQAVPLSVSC
jgi:hypothetical protein